MILIEVNIMKELYIAPEVELLCMVSAEQIAETDYTIPFNDFMGGGGGGGQDEGVLPSDGDVDIDI